jgi:hypothetical protein
MRRLWIVFAISLAIFALPLPGYQKVLGAGDALTLHLNRPDEGETYYAGPSSLQYSVQVNGSIQSSEYPPEQISISLDLIQDGIQKDTFSMHPDQNGIFTFGVTVNPEGSVGNFTPVEIEGKCEDCHYQAELTFPPGPVLLRVTAQDPAGQRVVVERHLFVDLTSLAKVPVKVVLEGNPEQPVPGVTVSASTWMYLWRARHKSGTTDSTGVAEMRVESSTQSPLKYVFQVEPSIVDGILYESVVPQTLILQPGQLSASSLTLKVRAKKGAIAGSLSGVQSSSTGGLPVLAVHLPDGSSTRVQTQADGKFAFSDLPIGKYLIMADQVELRQRGYTAKTQTADLTQANSVSIDLQASTLEGKSIHGTLRDEQGQPLRFAWAFADGSNVVQSVDPRSGGITLFGISSSSRTVIFSAPGYFSRAEVISSVEPIDGFDLRLTRRSETQSISWGAGEIFVPPESSAQVHGDQINLQQGWLWGRGGSGKLMKIQVGGITIDLASADFALEQLPNQSAWLFVMHGKAAVHTTAQSEPVQVGENQMAVLNPGQVPAPVSLNPDILVAINLAHSQPVPVTWEPTIQALVRDRLARIGVSTAQVITGAGYLGLAVLIVFMPGMWLFIKIRARSTQAAQPFIIGEKHD